MGPAGALARSPLAVLALGLALAGWQAADLAPVAAGASGPEPTPPPTFAAAPEEWCSAGPPAWLTAVCPAAPSCPACPDYSPVEQLAWVVGPSVLTNLIACVVNCLRWRGRIAAGRHGAPPLRRGGGVVQ